MPDEQLLGEPGAPPKQRAELPGSEKGAVLLREDRRHELGVVGGGGMVERIDDVAVLQAVRACAPMRARRGGRVGVRELEHQ